MYDNWYETAKNAITSDKFILEDIIRKIGTLWFRGNLSDEQSDELKKLAQEKAKPENGYPSLEQRYADLERELAELKQQINQGDEVVPDPVEYPEFKKPLDDSELYMIGDKITYNGKKYTCIKDRTGWDPAYYPIGWGLVIEEPITPEEPIIPEATPEYPVIPEVTPEVPVEV